MSNTPSLDGTFTYRTVEGEFLISTYFDRPTPARGYMLHILDLVLTNEEDMVSQVEYASPIAKRNQCVIREFPFKYRHGRENPIA